MKAMKNLYFLGILITLFSQNSLAQADSVAWKFFYGGAYTYTKTDIAIIGNDTLSAYYRLPQNDTVYLKEGGDTTFYYKNGQLNFLYANNAQVGDIWHPLNSFQYACDTCHLNLKVKIIDSILISGQYLKRFYLKQTNQWGETFLSVQVIEKIGVYDGYGHSMGFLYEYMPILEDGTAMMDGPIPCLISYYSEELNYSYIIPDQSTCYNGLSEESAKNVPKILRNGNHIEVKWSDDPINLKLYNISGQMIQEVRDNKLMLPSQQGIYFLHIQQDQELRIIKIAN
jgi:hypothetical protein